MLKTFWIKKYEVKRFEKAISNKKVKRAISTIDDYERSPDNPVKINGFNISKLFYFFIFILFLGSNEFKLFNTTN